MLGKVDAFLACSFAKNVLPEESAMTQKKRILLLTTGGTIASVPGGEGLEPRRSDVMERELEQLRSY